MGLAETILNILDVLIRMIIIPTVFGGMFFITMGGHKDLYVVNNYRKRRAKRKTSQLGAGQTAPYTGDLSLYKNRLTDITF